LRFQRRQPVTVGAQDISQNEGVAGVALGGDGAVARAARLDDVGMDRGDEEAGLDQLVDKKPAGPLDSDRRLAGRAVSAQPRHQMVETVAIVSHGEVIEAPAGRVDNTNGMARPAPVETDENGHGYTSPSWSKVPCAGSPYGMLINRRSGQNLIGL